MRIQNVFQVVGDTAVTTASIREVSLEGLHCFVYIHESCGRTRRTVRPGENHLKYDTFASLLFELTFTEIGGKNRGARSRTVLGRFLGVVERVEKYLTNSVQ